MKYLFLILFLVSCAPKAELLSDSKSKKRECQKICKEEFGDRAELDFVGSLTGTCYCRD